MPRERRPASMAALCCSVPTVPTSTEVPPWPTMRTSQMAVRLSGASSFFIWSNTLFIFTWAVIAPVSSNAAAMMVSIRFMF